MPPIKPVKLPKEQRDQITRLIQQFFEEEHDLSLGDLAADNVLSFFMSQIGPYVYNQALSDCRTLISQRMVSLEEDVYAMEQKVKLSR